MTPPIGISKSFSVIPSGMLYYEKEELEKLLKTEREGVIAKYCSVPEKYAHCTLEGLENPSPHQQGLVKILRAFLGGDERLCEKHQKVSISEPSQPGGRTVYFPLGREFRQNYSSVSIEEAGCPLRPKKGLYIYGEPGRAKTHLTYAYVHELMALFKAQSTFEITLMKELGSRLAEEAINDNLSMAYAKLLIKKSEESNNQELQNAAEEMLERASNFYAAAVRGNQAEWAKGRYFSQRDAFVLDFDTIMELSADEPSILGEAITTPILVLDDVHFKGKMDRAEKMQDLLEKRYAHGRRATFMNSNLSPQELVSSGNQDLILRARLLSRINEMFIPYNINDAEDYREKKFAAEDAKTVEDIISGN